MAFVWFSDFFLSRMFFSSIFIFVSETGHVLTTMMAGDFFGEIGILNLDGLNK